jgi:hypothetical protein
MAKPPLTVQNAAITTASVEIKTLTVSGKQVTLAVFRQLLEQPLVREDGTLAGQPWGIVNYHPDKCAGSPVRHWHVVWQEGSELRRSGETAHADFGVFSPEEADQFVTSCVYDVLTTGGTPHFQGSPPLSQWAGADRVEIPTDHGFPAVIEISWLVRKAIRSAEDLKTKKEQSARYNETPGGWFGEQLAQAERRHATDLAALAEQVRSFGAATDELHARYLAVVGSEPARRGRPLAVRGARGQLPQLFIAV